MKFTVQHAREVIGQHIDVLVIAESGETIASVTTTLDGSELANDSLDSTSVSYHRIFDQAGSAGSGMEHTLVVHATDSKGGEQSATEKWQDNF